MKEIESQKPPIRLLLVDDHSIVRSGLANMLNGREEFVVVGEAGNGETAIRLHDELCPDLTLLDVVMPGMSGIECLKSLKAQHPESNVMMLSSSELEHDVFQAMEFGADGYITKTVSPSELIDSIIGVCNGQTIIGNSVSERVAAYAESSQLTPREMEVLLLLRHGRSNPDIGDELDITARTAKAHVAAILLKLNARDRAEAVARGFERGLLRS
ncbi:MAG: response regulator transcription factor [Planctomycetota bacterium]